MVRSLIRTVLKYDSSCASAYKPLNAGLLFCLEIVQDLINSDKFEKKIFFILSFFSLVWWKINKFT